LEAQSSRYNLEHGHDRRSGILSEILSWLFQKAARSTGEREIVVIPPFQSKMKLLELPVLALIRAPCR